MRNTADPAAVEGDLRPVTVLFADIRGFTRLAELLPPEKLVGAINGCFEVLDEGIAHYGGEIDKFLGDAIMATFGESLAHDDDPRRAVLAVSPRKKINQSERQWISRKFPQFSIKRQVTLFPCFCQPRKCLHRTQEFFHGVRPQAHPRITGHRQEFSIRFEQRHYIFCEHRKTAQRQGPGGSGLPRPGIS